MTRNRLAILVDWLLLLLLLLVVGVCDDPFNAFKGYAAKYGVVLIFSFIATDFRGPAFINTGTTK